MGDARAAPLTTIRAMGVQDRDWYREAARERERATYNPKQPRSSAGQDQPAPPPRRYETAQERARRQAWNRLIGLSVLIVAGCAGVLLIFRLLVHR